MPDEPASPSSFESQSLDSPRHETPLLTDRSFLGFTVTQFLGAFNDNLYKQLILLLAIPTAAAATAGQGGAVDMQGVATMLFGLPFVLFSGIAGHLADRFRKTMIIRYSKGAEIAVMLLGMCAFLSFPSTGNAGLWTVLFLMGLQSTFFGPAKYGILPELFRERDLPRANGIILMTTFLAIIFGTASAGFMSDAFLDEDQPLVTAQNLWLGSLICVGIALAGTATAFFIRRTPRSSPDSRFTVGVLMVPANVIRMLRRDRQLTMALGASCAFWMIAGMAMQAVNALGRTQLKLDMTRTSIMASVIGLGIAIGAVIAGRLCRGRPSNTVIQIGMWGLVGLSLVMAVPFPGDHLLGFQGSLVVLILLGVAAAFFSIPVQVIIQARPPGDMKGRMIAVMNQANFLAIVMAGALFQATSLLLSAIGGPPSMSFLIMALLFLPVAILYRVDPQIEDSDSPEVSADDNAAPTRSVTSRDESNPYAPSQTLPGR